MTCFRPVLTYVAALVFIIKKQTVNQREKKNFKKKKEKKKVAIRATGSGDIS